MFKTNKDYELTPCRDNKKIMIKSP